MDPDLDATDIAVSVKKAWITLAGSPEAMLDKYGRDGGKMRGWHVRDRKLFETRISRLDERPVPISRLKR
jgi:hypothetical protein